MKTWAQDDPKAALMARKREVLVRAALRAFLESGYAESSVNRIAADAGVSIKTLYRHFQSKDDLFSAVMQAACDDARAEDAQEGRASTKGEPAWFAEPPATGLPLAGREYLRHALSEARVALYRVVAQAAHRFPEIGRRYQEEVIEPRYMAFIAYVDRWLPKTRWKISDKRGAATVFASLLDAGLLEPALLHGRRPKEREIRVRAEEASVRMIALFESGLL